MLDVKINMSSPAEDFYGAYQARKKKNYMDSLMKSAKPAEELPRMSFKEKYGATVTISEESREFLAHVREWKEAARAEREAAAEAAEPANHTNSFEENGHFLAQYLVLSENLYRNGFYDDLSDEEVKEMEGMLEEITSGMNAINGGIINLSEQMTHESAGLELDSSVRALNYFAEKYVPAEMRDSFQEVIGQYEKYNRDRVESFKGMEDIRNENARDLSSGRLSSNASVRRSQEVTRARMEIARVTHTPEEKETQQARYDELFDRLVQKKDSVSTIFGEMQQSLADYAAGGSGNSLVYQLLNKQNGPSFQRMASYWSRLL